jgi:hypothetical protein
MEEIINNIKSGDWQHYREIITACKERDKASEGIPAIIGLDDLTGSRDTVYEGAPADQEAHLHLAMGAMIFASLYENEERYKEEKYPAIAPAMSAVAEMFFHQGTDGKMVPYQQVVAAFLREEKTDD